MFGVFSMWQTKRKLIGSLIGLLCEKQSHASLIETLQLRIMMNFNKKKTKNKSIDSPARGCRVCQSAPSVQKGTLLKNLRGPRVTDV